MKKITFLFFVLSTCFSLFGQQNNLQKIDAYLNDYYEKIPIPGFSITIVEKDKVLFSKGYGIEKKGVSNLMTVQSSLGIGSLGRAFTAVGIMQLVEQGKVELDAPVMGYLPWFKTANPTFSNEITVRMCLSNTTAIPAQFEAVPSLNPDKSLAKFVRSMEGYYVKRKPGLAYEFSDEGYSIAGLIISELTGMTYADYIEKYIFQPLEMTRTTTNPSKFDALKILYGHEMALMEAIPTKKQTVNGNFFPAGSAMKSSAGDFGNFMMMLLNDGKFKHQSFLQPESIETIFKSNISFQGLGTMLGGNGIDIQCGLSWLEMQIEDRTIYILVGNTGTTAAIAGLSRDQNQGVVMLFNGDVNRLNRFVYPTLENTANNIIHILNNEPTTDFAITRFEDPYEDEDFELPKEKWGKYLGTYYAVGKESPFFKNIHIEIFETDNGRMQLKAFNQEQLKGHYNLQFTNESRAVLRNISQPREIQFKVFPNGAIGGLFMFGTAFKKRAESLDAKFKTLQYENQQQRLSFSMPKNVQTTLSAAAFSATFPNLDATTFQLQTEALGNNDFEDFVEITTHNQTIQTKGNVITKNLNDGIWTEQTIFAYQEDQLLQYIFTLFQDLTKKQQAKAVFVSPYGQFSTELQEILLRYQSSIRF